MKSHMTWLALATVVFGCSDDDSLFEKLTVGIGETCGSFQVRHWDFVGEKDQDRRCAEGLRCEIQANVEDGPSLGVCVDDDNECVATNGRQDECADGFECADGRFQPTVCLPACDTDLDCEQEYPFQTCDSGACRVRQCAFCDELEGHSCVQNICVRD